MWLCAAVFKKKMTMILLRFFCPILGKEYKCYWQNVQCLYDVFSSLLLLAHSLKFDFPLQKKLTIYKLLRYFDNCIVYRHSSRLSCVFFCRNVYQATFSLHIWSYQHFIKMHTFEFLHTSRHSSTDALILFFLINNNTVYKLWVSETSVVSKKEKNRIFVKYACSFFTLVL